MSKDNCKNKANFSKKKCENIGCNFVSPKKGNSYCRSPVSKKLKQPHKEKNGEEPAWIIEAEKQIKLLKNNGSHVINSSPTI